MEPVPSAAVVENCTSGLPIELFDDSDKAGTDVLLRGCPQSGMLNPVEDLRKFYEEMVEFSLILEMFYTKDLWFKICSVVFLSAPKPAFSSATISSICGFNLLSMIFRMILLGWLMRLTIGSPGTVQAASLGTCGDQVLGPRGW